MQCTYLVTRLLQPPLLVLVPTFVNNQSLWWQSRVSRFLVFYIVSLYESCHLTEKFHNLIKFPNCHLQFRERLVRVFTFQKGKAFVFISFRVTRLSKNELMSTRIWSSQTFQNWYLPLYETICYKVQPKPTYLMIFQHLFQSLCFSFHHESYSPEDRFKHEAMTNMASNFW